MSGERSLRECLQTEVDTIRDALPAKWATFADWYDDGMPIFAPTFGDVSYARGYLQGAADLADQTLMTLLDEHSVLMNQLPSKPKSKPRRARKKA